MRFNSKQPTVYLDFDGVLHPECVYRTRSGIVLRDSPEHTLFEHAPLLSSLLAAAPDVQVVLSTSWVKELSFSAAKNRLPLALRDRVVGATWHSRMSTFEWGFMTRYAQIQAHATRHQVVDWLALDDDDEGWHPRARNRLVHCDKVHGLNTPDNLAALKSWLTHEWSRL